MRNARVVLGEPVGWSLTDQVATELESALVVEGKNVRWEVRKARCFREEVNHEVMAGVRAAQLCSWC